MLFCLKLQLDKALRRLLEPEPLLQEGRARAKSGALSAMMDNSY
ncbi:MAG: hypothetical protein ACP5PV_04405 [Methanothrix sp.]